MEDPVYVGWPEVFSAYLFVLLAWFVRRAFEVIDTFLP